MAKPYAYKVHYHNDGTGRDTYIGISSGGLYAPFRPVAAPPVGSFDVRKSWKEPNPIIHSRAVHYYSDGSGRDSYIIRTEGGLAKDRHYVDSLT